MSLNSSDFDWASSFPFIPLITTIYEGTVSEPVRNSWRTCSFHIVQFRSRALCRNERSQPLSHHLPYLLWEVILWPFKSPSMSTSATESLFFSLPSLSLSDQQHLLLRLHPAVWSSFSFFWKKKNAFTAIYQNGTSCMPSWPQCAGTYLSHGLVNNPAVSHFALRAWESLESFVSHRA